MRPRRAGIRFQRWIEDGFRAARDDFREVVGRALGQLAHQSGSEMRAGGIEWKHLHNFRREFVRVKQWILVDHLEPVPQYRKVCDLLADQEAHEFVEASDIV